MSSLIDNPYNIIRPTVASSNILIDKQLASGWNTPGDEASMQCEEEILLGIFVTCLILGGGDFPQAVHTRHAHLCVELCLHTSLDPQHLPECVLVANSVYLALQQVVHVWTHAGMHAHAHECTHARAHTYTL